MTQISFGHRLTMMVLLLATLVVVPAVDATLCAFEVDVHAPLRDSGADGSYSEAAYSEITYPEVTYPEAGGGSEDQDYGHGSCSHGHCHHTSAHVPPNPTATADSPHPAHPWPGIDAVVSHTPDGLKRPPKA